MSSSQHIAIVDDYPDIRELVAQYLTQEGYRVSAMADGVALRELLDKDSPDLIILDVMMPGEDGLSLCRHIRSRSNTPVLFLSARTEDLDVILGLEMGGDDYLKKPFNPRELLARVKALLRRATPASETASSLVEGSIRFGEWVLNCKLRELCGADGVSVSLSGTEFRLLAALLERPGEIVTRDELINKVSGRTSEPFDRSIDNQVSRLRRKIEPDPKNPIYIRTHWGGGYAFVHPVSKST
ncbi:MULTISPECIES: response regulator [Pseudomonas]|uniref:response regulator n=1 Tax=Pseudomonas TaxID=286 RepID=UPI00215EF65F|nr:response regulator [Pseudomonas sp. B21-047]UVL01945.1 response regulator [Pseudomonas sp. B21-047]